MTATLWHDTEIVRIPDAWTIFTYRGVPCERWQDGRIMAFVDGRYRLVDTDPVRIGVLLAKQMEAA